MSQTALINQLQHNVTALKLTVTQLRATSQRIFNTSINTVKMRNCSFNIKPRTE